MLGHLRLHPAADDLEILLLAGREQEQHAEPHAVGVGPRQVVRLAADDLLRLRAVERPGGAVRTQHRDLHDGLGGRTLVDAADLHLERRQDEVDPDADRAEVLDRRAGVGLLWIRAEKRLLFVERALERGRRDIRRADGCRSIAPATRQVVTRMMLVGFIGDPLRNPTITCRSNFSRLAWLCTVDSVIARLTWFMAPEPEQMPLGKRPPCPQMP